MRKVETSLAFTDERCVCNHGEGGGSAIGKLQVDNLVVNNVIVGFVDAEAIRAGLECLGDVFNVRNPVNDRADWPSRVTTRNAFKID